MDWIVSLTLLSAPASTASAAAITWAPPVTLAGDAEVSNAGNLVFAYNWKSASQTVNGVEFSPPGDGVTLSGGSVNGTYPFSSPSSAAFSPAYRAILPGAYAENAAAPHTLTVVLNNLIVGHQYQVQWWAEDSRSLAATRNTILTSSGGNTVTLALNASGTNNGAGQYSLGTFAADATSQTIVATANVESHLNALQLRDMSPAVPALAAPAFSPPGGQYFGAQTVTLTSDPGSTVYYTTDGGIPTTASDHGPVGAGAATVSVPAPEAMSIRAIATRDGFSDSSLASASYSTVTTLDSGPLEIRFDTPATTWASQALPVGNGSMGAMIFGSPYAEHMQFNDISLWTGGANPSGSYNVNSFGCYQNFGDLYLGSGKVVSNPTEANHFYFYDTQKVDKSVDGTNAKWCFEHKNAPIIWQCTYPSPATITGYTFTAADDVPQRDPKAWVFEGSNDGATWTQLDIRTLDASSTPSWPFAVRNGINSFTPTAAGSYRHYRFVFTPYAGVSHFQVAEIALAGEPPTPTPTNMSRVLDLRSAMHTVSWTDGGVSFRRETLASHPHQVLATLVTADAPGKITTTLRLAGAHGETTTVSGNELSFSGTLGNGLRYATRVRVIASGGTLVAGSDTLQASNCDSLLILHAAATDYAGDAATTPAFRSGIDPAAAVAARLGVAQAAGYDTLKAAHLADYHALFNRCSLDLGPPPAETLTPARLAAYKAGGFDPHLEAMMFHYGRYLLISSSRGSLPANLQGLWNNSNTPPWFSDYHVNINLQMNYWAAEPTNLPECHEPLFNYLGAIAPLSRTATKASFGAATRGWTMRTSVNPFGGHGWNWDTPSSAWTARHYWQHYAFTGDTGFLQNTAWPVMKEICEFWIDRLADNGSGKLVAPQGWSPEHGPTEDGVSYVQEIVWDLFSNTIAAEEVLHNDPAFRAQLIDLRSRLLVPAIGPQGQVTEWANPATEAAYGYGTSDHRHTSHLYAVYPGFQFNPVDAPTYVAAAKLSLADRGTSGDSRHSWTWPWRAALWARMGEPDKAHEMLRGLLSYNTFGNLFVFANADTFQIDGSLGIPAAMAEMLVQSHAGEISVLPEIPAAWPSGSFTGICAQGGFEIDATWHNGKTTSIRIRSKAGKTAKLRLPDLVDSPGAFVRSDGGLRALTKGGDGTVSFISEAGGSYMIDTDVGNAVDNDGDGFTTYQEWLAGTDPDRGDSHLRAEIVGEGESFQARWPEIPDRKYVLQHSNDMIHWSDLVTHVPTATGQATHALPPGPRGFCRVIVTERPE